MRPLYMKSSLSFSEIVGQEIPKESVLGINYSGMHDTSISICSPQGDILFGASLERYTRVKQDGRPPFPFLKDIPWDRFQAATLTTNKKATESEKKQSALVPHRFKAPRPYSLVHEQPFYVFLDTIPVPKHFYCHQLCHAASSYYLSGFESAHCLTYDGGMCNSPWFGGLYEAKGEKITPLDQFHALFYPKITSLYTVVTALLGFTPSKHEGKITGLAAYGKTTPEVRSFLENIFINRYDEAESIMEWIHSYDSVKPPFLYTFPDRCKKLQEEISNFSREDIAATLQTITEEYICNVLLKAREKGWKNKSICLSGGLFSNVKINQRIKETGYENIFVSPPMTDDGTALGAALCYLVEKGVHVSKPVKTMFLGTSFTPEQNLQVLQNYGIQYQKVDNGPQFLAEQLAAGKVVALFQGGMEFGPRALGHRSVLSQASKPEINTILNERFHRTEFMPFAPMTRIEDAEACYLNAEGAKHTAQFMTITFDCTPFMKEKCPATVHVDGTARPQLITKEAHPFIHETITHYFTLTGRPAIINTSFNMHEEPIVCSPEDAIEGFLESGIDILYMEGGYAAFIEQNTQPALTHFRTHLGKTSQKEQRLANLVESLQEKTNKNFRMAIEKETVIQKLLKNNALVVQSSEAKEDYIRELHIRLDLGGFKFRRVPGFLEQRFMRLINRRIFGKFKRKLGILKQYAPRPLVHDTFPKPSLQNGQWPSILIVTPSYQQADFLEQTIRSITEQNYPNLQYFVQDGGSKDHTVSIIKRYEKYLTGWTSEPDGGQANAINAGFAKGYGDIMAWVNSDDCLAPGVLHYIAEYFAKHPKVDVVYGHRVIIDTHGDDIGRWFLPSHNPKELRYADYIPQETMFWRRSLWEKVGGYVDESFQFALDWNLLLRFLKAGARFARLPYFMGYFRYHKSQKSLELMETVGSEEMDRIRKAEFKALPHHWVIDRQVQRMIFKSILIAKLFEYKIRI